jgi:hypothetical protein
VNASAAQRKKVRDLRCLVCGVDRHEAKIDPAHVYASRYAHCECPDGVVALCRSCHNRYDDLNSSFDLLPYLLNGWRTELCHAILEHDARPFHVLGIVTGVQWCPVESERTAA